MSRLGGGIGTRGPGEKKLEMDRRLIKSRIAQLNRELKDVKKHREVNQRAEKQKPYSGSSNRRIHECGEIYIVKCSDRCRNSCRR